MNDEILDIDVKHWVTPASKYIAKKIGTAEIRKGKQSRGYHRMEGIGGYVLYYTKQTLPITSLYIDGQQWMIDDVLHWTGMRRFGEMAEGDVLVGGLGLGLVTQALIDNPKVNSITIIERNRDVINLISKYIAWAMVDKGKSVEIMNEDYLSWIVKSFEMKHFDYAILDFWVGKGDRHKLVEMQVYADFTNQLFQDAKVWIWGINSERYNPAFKNSEALKQFKKLESEEK